MSPTREWINTPGGAAWAIASGVIVGIVASTLVLDALVSVGLLVAP